MRRAIAETALVAIILAVAGGLILAGVVGTLVVKGKAKAGIDACRSNVEIAVLSKEVFPVTKCFTKAEGVLDYPGNTRAFEEAASAQIARLLYECRYQYGENARVPWKGNLFSQQHVCSVCSTFQMPSHPAPRIAVSAVVDWMKVHTLSGGESYYDYSLLSSPGRDPDFLVMDEYNKDTNVAQVADAFTPGASYAVINYAIAGKRLTQISGAQLTWEGFEDVDETNWVFATQLTSLGRACSITNTRYP